MEKWILVLILQLSFCLTLLGQDELEWTENRKLTVNDFKATPPDPTTNQTLIASFGLRTNLKKDEIKNLNHFNQQVLNLFSQSNSWIDWTDKSRLRYAITLFDFNEWMTRELRKRLYENREAVLTGSYQPIQEEVKKEFAKLRQDYDLESNYGNNAIGQINWEIRINDAILSLGDYCKKCEPRKN